jgi:putative transposase
MDKSGVNKVGIDTINLSLVRLFMMVGLFLQIKVRQVKYLNTIVEQDPRFVKKITKPMKGFKDFHSARTTVAGIEPHHRLRKGPHRQAPNQSVLEPFYGLAA